MQQSTIKPRKGVYKTNPQNPNSVQSVKTLLAVRWFYSLMIRTAVTTVLLTVKINGNLRHNKSSRTQMKMKIHQ